MGFQSGRTLDSRISGIGFCTIPLIFFAIGMSVRHRLLKERSSATALTTAVVVSQGRRLRAGKNPAFFPEYEFHAGETLYRVTAPSGSGFHMSEGTIPLHLRPTALSCYPHSRLLCHVRISFPWYMLTPGLRPLQPFEKLLSVLPGFPEAELLQPDTGNLKLSSPPVLSLPSP